jgi:hypothetical protein
MVRVLANVPIICSRLNFFFRFRVLRSGTAPNSRSKNSPKNVIEVG